MIMNPVSEIPVLNSTKQLQVFMETYNILHPRHNSLDLHSLNREDRELYYVYANFLSWWHVMNEGYSQASVRNGKLLNQYAAIEQIRCVWLFYDFVVNDFHKKLITIILNSDRSVLSASDYALMLYVSSLEDTTFNKLPLPVLHDIFDPLAQQNITTWQEVE
jgi:hypothetical protein